MSMTLDEVLGIDRHYANNNNLNVKMTMDEVLEHCNKVCDFTEKYTIANGYKIEDIKSKQYWEHYNVREWLEELKEFREKNVAKKILYRKQYYGTPYLCPNCEADQVKVEFFSEDGSEPKEKHTYCWKCGQKIDWKEV